MREIGQTMAMCVKLKTFLENGGGVSVIASKADPKLIVNTICKLGLKVKATKIEPHPFLSSRYYDGCQHIPFDDYYEIEVE